MSKHPPMKLVKEYFGRRVGPKTVYTLTLECGHKIELSEAKAMSFGALHSQPCEICNWNKNNERM